MVFLATARQFAAHRTGTATDPAALNGGYALGLAVTAGLLPRCPAAMAAPQPAAPEKNRLEGTPS
ncbi:hypothetical protein [Streptomyces sp. NPDC057686]|uniref:hypothetical protein n=1 Tax=Streptomyces sp. NPDC057686 TaxID=3346212 RepID=UPI00367496BB